MPEQEPLLVLIFGASGSGKTTLLRELRSTGGRLTIHRKGTDRPPKKYDWDEIECVETVSPAKYEFIYRQYGNAYGIERQQIDASLNSGKDHFLICNDIEMIGILRQEYGDSVRCVFLLFNAPRAQIEAVQKARAISDDQVDLRLAKIGVLSELFLDNSALFDGVILNRIGEPSGRMVAQVEAVLGRRYSDLPVVSGMGKQVLSDMVEVIEVIHRNLQRPGLEAVVVQRGYVFILMAMIEDGCSP